jgi:hypothetical protein
MSLINSQLLIPCLVRYHIAGSEGIFYSREPYTNHGASHVTRFLGLAAVGNDKKEVRSYLRCPFVNVFCILL